MGIVAKQCRGWRRDFWLFAAVLVAVKTAVAFALVAFASPAEGQQGRAALDEVLKIAKTMTEVMVPLGLIEALLVKEPTACTSEDATMFFTETQQRTARVSRVVDRVHAMVGADGSKRYEIARENLPQMRKVPAQVDTLRIEAARAVRRMSPPCRADIEAEFEFEGYDVFWRISNR